MTASAINWARGLLARQSRNKASVKATTGGGRSSGEPVEVYRAANELEAQVVKGFLETNDIPVMLRHESLGPTLGVAVGSLAEVRIMVPELLAGRAAELLDAQAEAAALAEQAREDEI